MTIISRHWKSKQNDKKYFLAYEKLNLDNPTDSINGIYLFTSDINNVDTDNIGKEPFTIKIPHTVHPVSKLELDVHKSTVGIVWASQLKEGGFRISLSKSFDETAFVTCSDHIDDFDAVEISELNVTALENTIITSYTAKKTYNGQLIEIGYQTSHHPRPVPNPPVNVPTSVPNSNLKLFNY